MQWDDPYQIERQAKETKARLINIEDFVSKQVEVWAKNNLDETQLEQYIHALLDTKLKDTILKLLGFDQRWGNSWEIDHCNGRAGNSFIAPKIEAKAFDAAAKYVNAALKDAPTLTEAQKAAMRKEYKELVERAIKTNISRIAENTASALINELIDSAQISGASPIKVTLKTAKQRANDLQDDWTE